jgi:hypothetical protein
VSAGPEVGLDLVVDPAFRSELALAHAVRSHGVALHLADGSTCWVSHDSAFRPVMAPCQLRIAVADAAIGVPPRWLADVVGWSAGGPFVEPLGTGVLGLAAEGDRTCAFATALSPVVVDRLAMATHATEMTAGPDLELRLGPDVALGVTVARLSGPGDRSAVDRVAVELARLCRARSRALRAHAR